MADKKQNGHGTVNATSPEAIKKAAEDAKKAAGSTLTPTQVYESFADKLPREQQKLLKADAQEILEGFTQESGGILKVGRACNHAKSYLGELWPSFRDAYIVKALRKSSVTVTSYMARAQAAVVEFAKSKAITDAVFRIWNAEGCFDTETGELKPVVHQAIEALGGIPEDADSQASEVFARKFVDTVDGLVKTARAARPAEGKVWSSDITSAKHGACVKAFNRFLEHTTAKRSIKLLAELVALAGVKMSKATFEEAMKQANTLIAERRKEDVEEREQSKTTAPTVTTTKPQAAA